MRLSDHFTLDELIFSQTAVRKSLDNTPTAGQISNLKALCMNILEPVRVRVDRKPIYITSGFRGYALNKAIGGSGKSAHMEGFAADFVVPKFGTPKEVADIIACSDIEFDQLIYEGKWVHISYNPDPRREMLTARFGPDKTTYLAGIV